ncbi:LysR substrate-binding domain-containing protein [Methylobacterium sp. E-005]|uniref:LysR substrate-binding domain-containing protein n=1 Tax=Methylobacterium sp. E-005 TaxID=2836549 RepID=UPI001FBB7B36|nr:LysR substrate-binding domain-containing protein [Methylobacterium sp. E-005]MCJ2090589.1 LysR substrate-binding domain-containing protein [Methylobacterium sp. E-005]
MAARRMTFRHIEAFRAVVATGSMTEASRQLHTSQPQVSRLIAQLEAITGLPLFDRSGSRVVPSLDGTRFHAEVERAFVGLTSLEAAATRIRAFGAERLRVAAMPRLAGGLLARAVVRFRAAHPDVIVAIHSGDDETVNHWIATGSCDAALTMLYGDLPDAKLDHVETRACVAVLPQDHPLAARTALSPEDFRDVPFIAASLGSALRDRTEAIFATAGVALAITAEAGLGASICTLVSAGLGVSVMNPLAAHEEAKVSPIAIRPFAPALPVHFALLFPPDHARGRLMRAFGACARAVLLEELAALPDAANGRSAG